MRTSRHGGTRNSAASKRLMREIGIFDVSVKAREVMYVREIKVRVHVTKTQNRSVVSRGCRVKQSCASLVVAWALGSGHARPRRGALAPRGRGAWGRGGWRVGRAPGAPARPPSCRSPRARR